MCDVNCSMKRDVCDKHGRFYFLTIGYTDKKRRYSVAYIIFLKLFESSTIAVHVGVGLYLSEPIGYSVQGCLMLIMS